MEPLQKASSSAGNESSGDSVRRLNAPHLRIGEMLVEAGLITTAQIEEALEKQANWGSRFGDIVLAMGWVKPMQFYQVLARHFNLEFINLVGQPVEDKLLDPKEYLNYAQHLYLPWRRRNGVLWIATAEPGSAQLQRLATEPNVSFVGHIQVRYSVGIAAGSRPLV